MNLISKIIFGMGLIILSTSALAIDLLGYAGYTQINTFSDSSFDNTLGTLRGFNLGSSLLVPLIPGPISPVVGGGLNYMSLNSSTSSQGFNYSNTYTSAALIGNLGMNLSAPGINAFLLGNLGYGFSDSLKIAATIGGTTVASSTIKIQDHLFYGGTASFLFGIMPFVSLGVAGVYNLHSASFQNGAANVNTKTTYNEISANLIINFTL